jgi:hypothetical protein
MPATKLEAWIIRALMLLGPALGKADGEDVTLADAGRALQSQGLGLLAQVDYQKVKPLLDDLLGCCTRITKDGVEQACDSRTIDGYVQDVGTLFALRKEALSLNLSFFGQGQGGPLSFLAGQTSERPASVAVSRT